MRIDVSFKHLEKSPFLEGVIDKNIARTERRVRLFKSDEAIHLSLHLEKNPHRDEYFCWINMYLPYKVLKSQVRKNSSTVAINDCFSGILKQLDKFKHKLERHLNRRRSRRSQTEDWE
jgi:ribosome-associated translation inhibitor RaiA